jgi:antitoxin component YwqK of YwqJK toxin-antitoxin module
MENLGLSEIQTNTFNENDFAESYTGWGNEKVDFEFLPSDFDNENNYLNLTGKFISYWPQSWQEAYSAYKNKTPFSRGNYKNGLKDGLWEYVLCDGTTSHVGNFISGKMHGKWTNYNFCHNTFDFIDSADNSGLGIIYTIKSYYELEDSDWDINQEVIYFTNGIPSDTLYYTDKYGNIKLKVCWKNGTLFYDNLQPISSQFNIYFPNTTGTELKDLTIFLRNGNPRYKYQLVDKLNTETFYSKSGKVDKKLIYDNNGFCYVYDENGKKIDAYEMCFGCGKFEPECPCQ